VDAWGSDDLSRQALDTRFDVQEHAMYGSGQALPPPPTATRPGVVIGLRVFLTLLPIISLSLLAWVPMLRLGVLCKRTLDWLMLAVAAGTTVVGFTCFGFSHDNNDWQANTGTALLLICMFGSAGYFLVADILRARRGRERSPRWPAAPGYGQPHPYAAGPGTPAPGPADPRPQSYPAPQPYAAPAPIPGRTPPPPAAPTPPPAPRINQVRAELDELSDYLRKEEGR
jgi:hypothetical protein